MSGSSRVDVVKDVELERERGEIAPVPEPRKGEGGCPSRGEVVGVHFGPGTGGRWCMVH